MVVGRSGRMWAVEVLNYYQWWAVIGWFPTRRDARERLAYLTKEVKYGKLRISKYRRQEPRHTRFAKTQKMIVDRYDAVFRKLAKIGKAGK